MSNDKTTIEVSRTNADDLYDYIKRGGSYNDVVTKLLKEHELVRKYTVEDKITLVEFIKEVNGLWGRKS
ncbi:MAG: hypothetical protein ACOC1X_01385 [Promethearchaeota archaeon]